MQGNFIGTDISGATAVPNGGEGVGIGGNTASNTIGGTTAAARNIISGYKGSAVEIFNNGATGNLVQGNYIGTNAAGTAGVGNGDGVAIATGASGNTIGGTAAARATSSQVPAVASIWKTPARQETWWRGTSSAPTPPAAAGLGNANGVLARSCGGQHDRRNRGRRGQFDRGQRPVASN